MKLTCNGDCNKLLTKQEVINLINYALSINEFLFIGSIIYISKAVYDTNFAVNGLGTGDYKNWALANGNNGTENWTGRVPVTIDPTQTNLDTANKVGGNSSITIVEENLPSHNHDIVISNHTHDVTIPSHNHTTTIDTSNISTIATNSDGDGSYSVSGDIDFTWEEIPIEPTGASNIQVLVNTGSTLSGTTGTLNKSVANGSVTTTSHTHSTDATHTHNATTDNHLGSTETTTNAGGATLTSTSVGADNPINVMNPYVVVIPIQKIA